LAKSNCQPLDKRLKLWSSRIDHSWSAATESGGTQGSAIHWGGGRNLGTILSLLQSQEFYEMEAFLVFLFDQALLKAYSFLVKTYRGKT
jgi:hypothetical protein